MSHRMPVAKIHQTMLRKANLQEAEIAQAEHGGRPFERALFEDAFCDLRQTMLNIELIIDNGRLFLVIWDAER